MHVADPGVLRAPVLLARPPRPDRTAGLVYADMLTAAWLGPTILPRPRPGRVALFGVWRDDAALDRFLANDALAHDLGGGRSVPLQALQLSPPPAAFRAANHSITVAELGAVVDQLASQRAISRRARALLRKDLTAITRAGSGVAHTRALATLRRDVNRLARTTRAATETLLKHAAAGLS